MPEVGFIRDHLDDARARLADAEEASCTPGGAAPLLVSALRALECARLELVDAVRRSDADAAADEGGAFEYGVGCRSGVRGGVVVWRTGMRESEARETVAAENASGRWANERVVARRWWSRAWAPVHDVGVHDDARAVAELRDQLGRTARENTELHAELARNRPRLADLLPVPALPPADSTHSAWAAAARTFRTRALALEWHVEELARDRDLLEAANGRLLKQLAETDETRPR